MKKQKIPLQGVNLGGWLIAEKWMTPSLFGGIKATNEFDLVKTNEGKKRLARHHAAFITSSDISWLADQGVEILRVPFGHWIFGDQPPYLGAVDRLDWLIDEASKYNIQILLDLHGAPEAQNLKEHSGSGNRHRDSTWLDNKAAQQKTVDVLIRIAERYKSKPNVWGIELLNEPACDLTGIKLARFYRRAYRSVIKVARPGTRIVFSDGFHPILLTNALWLVRKKQYPAVLDMHIYHCFGQKSKRLSVTQHETLARRTHWLIKILSIMQPVIVGEWSNMLPYPVSPSKTAAFSSAQQHGFHCSDASFYWNYKTEAVGRWNFRNQITSGTLHILNSRHYNKE